MKIKHREKILPKKDIETFQITGKGLAEKHIRSLQEVYKLNQQAD